MRFAKSVWRTLTHSRHSKIFTHALRIPCRNSSTDKCGRLKQTKTDFGKTCGTASFGESFSFVFKNIFLSSRSHCSAGYLESGVSRIVDQVVEQKMDLIQSKVEEILYKKILGIEKPVKKEKQPNGALEVETDLLPTDLEQVSPDSDKKSNLSSEEIRDEEVEEEIVEDEDFESPAFEPVEAMAVDKNETSQHSNLSAISGLTSQDSVENKSSEPTSAVPQQDTQLSQISSAQDLSEETPEETAILAGEDAQMAMDLSGQPEEKVEKSQFDLKKDSIEFTGTERKSIQLDDSTNSGEAEKVLQPQDVPSNTMEIDNLYENDTTDSSEMRMEIDLKDETTQETAGSSKVEESSQDSTVSKDKQPKEPLPHSKQDPPKDKHKSSSHKSSSRHHHSSSSSKSRHDDKHKSRSGGKSSSSGQKKSSGEKERSSSCRRDHDKDRKSTKDDPARSKHRDHKTTDDHHQEKSASRRRRSTDHDSNDGKAVQGKLKDVAAPAGDKASTTDQKPAGVDKSLNESGESKSSTSSSAKKEQKSSILVKYDYLKSSGSKRVDGDVSEDECHGFDDEELPNNPWIELLRKEAEKAQQKKPNRRASINNCLEQKKLDTSLKAKGKAKANSPGKIKLCFVRLVLCFNFGEFLMILLEEAGHGDRYI